MIDQIKESYFKNKIQFIQTDKEGIIEQSDNNLFSLKIGSSLYDAHPFFESIEHYIDEQKGSECAIPCVHLEVDDTDGIYDVHLRYVDNKIIISIFDFTRHYIESNTLSQEKNESVIQTQLLKEKEEFKNRFLANTSHELRTPLTTIMGFTTVLQRSNISTEQLHYLDIIKSSGENLRNLIDDILDISKIEMGRLKIKHDRFDVKKLCNLLQAQYSLRSKEQGIDLLIKLDSSLPQFLVGDKLRLNQILTNLIDNAFKFTSKGRIQLSIFESFIQAHDDPSISGTGLGLSIVKKLIDLMGGSISVESTKNLGTSFVFNLGFRVSSNQTEDKVESPKTVGRTSDKYNILVAEDVEVNQLLIMKILASSGKYFVDIVSDGDQVVERLHQQEYDLILMDLKMPKMDGYDATRFIRQSEIETIKNIPIIALTANVTPLEREICLGIGMNEYIGKPYKEDELLGKIDLLIHKK